MATTSTSVGFVGLGHKAGACLAVPGYFTSTSATRLTPLSAMAMLPSRVTIMLRTTPPPEGIVQVWNFSVAGSKRTSVLGRTPASLYQTTPSGVEAIPYGWDLGPLHPLISAGIFYLDVAALPYHAATDPLRRYECNPGYALPGDPMPLLLYLPKVSLPGALAEAAAIGWMEEIGVDVDQLDHPLES